MDFLQWLDTDMVLNIFNCLDDSADLVRASIASRKWHDFGELHELIFFFFHIAVLAVCYNFASLLFVDK